MDNTTNALIVLVVAIIALGALWFFVRREFHHTKPLVLRRSTPPSSVLPLPSPSAGARLVCVQGPVTGHTFPLRGTRETIGRVRDNSIIVEGMLVSRHHAQILPRGGQYVLLDQESTNGTYVNDRRIVEHVLQPGDRVQIGETVFVFQVGAEAIVRPVSPMPTAAPAPAPSVPSVVGRDLKTYRITETIGSGGAATVYKGISLIDQSPVAIKILHETDPIIREKFEQEGRIGLRLQHPHIARIYHYGESTGTYYIVMELVDGGSLRQQLTHGRPVPLNRVQAVIGQTCEALSYAHSRNVIHRDVKPENILFSTRDGVKMVDFGIAKLTTAGTKTAEGILIGTPFYMSYEQAKGVEVTPASDIYSLGVVLYEMLTGQWPFEGEPLVVIYKHLTENPLPPRRINPAIPVGIETVVMRALDKNARRRYQTAMEMAAALGYQPGAPTAVQPVGGLTTMPPQGGNLPVVSPPQPVSPPPRARVPRLVVIQGRTKGKVFELTQEVVTLGRNEIDASDLVISRQHLRVIRQGEHFWLEDTGSKNGTFVNGVRMMGRTMLRTGVVIQVGQTLLSFQG
jgi:serine/threonine protein kinase